MAKSERPTHRCEGCGVYLFREELDLGGGHPQARGDGRYDSCGPVSLVAPQQEPEGDEDRTLLRWVREALTWAFDQKVLDVAEFNEKAETLLDDLRARVQPRTVSEEEVEALVDTLGSLTANAWNRTISTGQPTAELWAGKVLEALGLTITPTEEQDDGE